MIIEHWPEELLEVFSPTRQTKIVDVGASPVDGPPPYQRLLDSGCCKVIGFEPQPEQIRSLYESESENELYIPHVIGNGKEADFYTCYAPGMSSCLEPNKDVLYLYPHFEKFGEVVNTERVNTISLDRFCDEDVDYLKIDIQGGEMMVFDSAPHVMRGLVAVETEAALGLSLYKNGPVFRDIDLSLSKYGLVFHTFSNIKKLPISAMRYGDPGYSIAYEDISDIAPNQIMECDAVYFYNPIQLYKLSVEKLKHFAIIAHVIYGSYDLALRAARAIDLLNEDGEKGYLKKYSAFLESHNVRINGTKLF